MTVGIIYGLSEGPLIGRRLIAQLRAAGYHTTRDLAAADIIIAHSGGCFLIPVNARASLLLLVGLPYWPGRHPLRFLHHKFRLETKNLFWLQKTLANSYYLLFRPDLTFRLWRAWKRASLPPAEPQTATVIAVRNHHDVFQHPDEYKKFAHGRGWQIHELPGQHDDLWENPDPYIQLINQALQRE